MLLKPTARNISFIKTFAMYVFNFKVINWMRQDRSGSEVFHPSHKDAHSWTPVAASVTHVPLETRATRDASTYHVHWAALRNTLWGKSDFSDPLSSEVSMAITSLRSWTSERCKVSSWRTLHILKCAILIALRNKFAVFFLEVHHLFSPSPCLSAVFPAPTKSNVSNVTGFLNVIERCFAYVLHPVECKLSWMDTLL